MGPRVSIIFRSGQPTLVGWFNSHGVSNALQECLRGAPDDGTVGSNPQLTIVIDGAEDTHVSIGLMMKRDNHQQVRNLLSMYRCNLRDA